MLQRDLPRIAAYEAEWNRLHRPADKQDAEVSKTRALSV